MEETFSERREAFLEEFRQCQAALFALGDNTRQCIIITLIKNGGKGGLRVGEIQMETSVSRTAVSHHLKVLLETGIINVRRKGTMNFYYLDPNSSSLRQLTHFWEQVEPMMDLCEKNRKTDEKGEYR